MWRGGGTFKEECGKEGRNLGAFLEVRRAGTFGALTFGCVFLVGGRAMNGQRDVLEVRINGEAEGENYPEQKNGHLCTAVGQCPESARHGDR